MYSVQFVSHFLLKQLIDCLTAWKMNSSGLTKNMHVWLDIIKGGVQNSLINNTESPWKWNLSIQTSQFSLDSVAAENTRMYWTCRKAVCYSFFLGSPRLPRSHIPSLPTSSSPLFVGLVQIVGPMTSQTAAVPYCPPQSWSQPGETRRSVRDVHFNSCSISWARTHIHPFRQLISLPAVPHLWVWRRGGSLNKAYGDENMRLVFPVASSSRPWFWAEEGILNQGNLEACLLLTLASKLTLDYRNGRLWLVVW